MRNLALIPIVCLGLAGCGPETDEGDVITAADELNSTIVGEGDDSDLLLGFEVYPGAEVPTNMSSEELSMLLFTTQDSAEKVIAFYREQGEARGFELSESNPMDNKISLRGKNAEGHELNLLVTDEEGVRTGDMAIRLGG